MELKFRITQAAINQQYVATGQTLGATQTRSCLDDAIPAELRAKLVEAWGKPQNIYELHYHPGVGYWSSNDIYTIGEVPGDQPEDVVRILTDFFAALETYRAESAREKAEEEDRQMANHIETLTRALQSPSHLDRYHVPTIHESSWGQHPRYAEARSLYEQVLARIRQQDEAEEVVRQAREKVEAEDRAKRATEKATWIEEHGTDYLRRAHQAGYSCQRLYVTERADLELPGYVVDFDNQAEWRSRSCPTLDALDELEDVESRGYTAEVVWLTKPVDPAGDDAYRDFEPCEAVVVRVYLGKYDAVKLP